MIESIPHRNPIFRNSLAASLAILVVVLPLRLPAQEVEKSIPNLEFPRHPLTLQDCIAIALGESPKLEAERFDVLAATAEVRAEQGKALPKLTGLAEPEIFSGNPVGKFSFFDEAGNAVSTTRKDVNFGTLDDLGGRLRYSLFKDGSILGLNNPPAVQAKRAHEQALEWTTHLTREEVIYRITDSFITTVAAQNRVGPVDRRVSLLEQSVSIVHERQRQGLSLPIDVKVIEEELSGARTLSKIVHEEIVAGRKGLAMALGLPSASALNLSSTLPNPPPEPPSAEMLIKSLLRIHPSLQVQRAKIDKAKQEYRLERFRLYPSVSLDGSALYVDDFSPPARHVYTGAVVVNVPIFDFGAQSATVRAKKMTYLGEQVRLAAVADDVTYEVVTAYQQIYVLSQRILSVQKEVAKADREAQLTASRQQQGITEPLIANEAQLTLLEKRDDLQLLQARRLLLYAALQKATGGEWKWIP
jgi:outer membrane protein TolC